MAREEVPVQARPIPPRIAEAVAGMELLGSDLVDRSTILRAVEQITGESVGEIVREASLNPILEAFKKGSEEKAEILSQTGNSEAIREFRQAIKQSAEILSSSVDQDALGQLAEAAKRDNRIFNQFQKSGAMKALGQLAEAAKRDNRVFNQFQKSDVVKAFEQFAQIAKQQSQIADQFDNSQNTSSVEQITRASTQYEELFSRVFNSDILKAFTEASMRNEELFSRVVNSDAMEALAQTVRKNAEIQLKTIKLDELKVFSQTFEDADVLGNVIGASVLQTIRKESRKLDDMIRLMNDSGWLLPTQTRGWWEFAPGVRGGAYTSGNPYMALIAALAKKPDLELAVTMESAAFVHRLSEHRPRKDVIAVPKGVSRQGSLGSYRQVELQLPKFASIQMDEIPVHSIAGLLAAMAIRPLAFRDWPNVKKWLPKACELVIRAASNEHGSFEGEGSLLEILESRSIAARARVAYFFKVAGQVDAAEEIIRQLPDDFIGPVYLGSREAPSAHAKYDSLTRVYDRLIDPK